MSPSVQMQNTSTDNIAAGPSAGHNTQPVPYQRQVSESIQAVIPYDDGPQVAHDQRDLETVPIEFLSAYSSPQLVNHGGKETYFDHLGSQAEPKAVKYEALVPVRHNRKK